MKSYIGILGDPAKINLYEDDFYSVLNWDKSKSSFYLLGASENNVQKKDYLEMFKKIEKNSSNLELSPIKGLSKAGHKNSRVGLFPSSSSHLIKGPSFSFAPFPVNSRSKYLKFKSKFLSSFLQPFYSFKIRSLAYLPLGGKAALKTKAMEINKGSLSDIFAGLRLKNKFDWYYLEAGSGEDFLPISIINEVLKSQFEIIKKDFKPNSQFENLENGSRIIIPKFIYGGGIKSLNQIKSLLEPKNDQIKLIPQIIIIGNISEENLSQTYKLVELVGELNEIKTISLNTHLV